MMDTCILIYVVQPMVLMKANMHNSMKKLKLPF